MKQNKQSLAGKAGKKIILIICFVLLVGLAAFYLLNSKKEIGNPSVVDSVSTFLNIEDALNKKLSLYCEFSGEDGYVVKSYIKNGAIRVSSASGEMISVENKMYIWDSKINQGIVYDINMSQNATSSTGVTQTTNYLEVINEHKDLCKVSTVDDSFFVIPTEVEFQDMSKFLQDMGSQQPQVNPQN